MLCGVCLGTCGQLLPQPWADACAQRTLGCMARTVTGPSPREIEALAVAAETERLITEVRSLLDRALALRETQLVDHAHIAVLRLPDVPTGGSTTS